jgi:hypothetical protein
MNPPNGRFVAAARIATFATAGARISTLRPLPGCIRRHSISDCAWVTEVSSTSSIRSYGGFFIHMLER